MPQIQTRIQRLANSSILLVMLAVVWVAGCANRELARETWGLSQLISRGRNAARRGGFTDFAPAGSSLLIPASSKVVEYPTFGSDRKMDRRGFE